MSHSSRRKPNVSAWSQPASTITEILPTTRPSRREPYAGRSKTRSAWTKYSLNYWYRIFDPAFETLLDLERIRFSGSNVAEGLVVHRRKLLTLFVANTKYPWRHFGSARRG
uniref:U1764w n=1 Tax=Mycobacterium leprae TaxID=1769 RepID=Q50006_MYCLR|nr:u1764w [Mycobacterium leprae]